MRIVAGALRGRAVVAPKGHSTRPTADRTRQAVFDILEHASWSPGLDKARVVDLFAGSGAMGLEALSRGAAFCVFADTSEASRTAVRENLRSLRLTNNASVERFDATRLSGPPSGARFDFAFLDPPYARGMSETALVQLRRHDWVAPQGIVVVERGVGEPPLETRDFETFDVRSWGAARVYFIKSRSSPAE